MPLGFLRTCMNFDVDANADFYEGGGGSGSNNRADGCVTLDLESKLFLFSSRSGMIQMFADLYRFRG